MRQKKAPANKKAPILTELFLGFSLQLLNLFLDQALCFYTQIVIQLRKT
jgi:hypothetical protein